MSRKSNTKIRKQRVQAPKSYAYLLKREMTTGIDVAGLRASGYRLIGFEENKR